jgi:AhpD family alkylhydroperoxidase
VSARVAMVSAGEAGGLVADTYAQIERDFGRVVDPFSVHSADPQLLAAAWGACRETLVSGAVPRERKELVAVAVSAANRCPYCVDAHAVMLHALGHAELIAVAEREGDALAEWARSTSRRETTGPPPGDAAAAPELLGTAVCFHYVDRVVSALIGDGTPLPAGGRMRAMSRRAGGRAFRSAVRRPKRRDDSADLLPSAPVPVDFGWATPDPAVAQAFARLAAATDVAGERALPPEVRALVESHLDDWDGEPPPLSRAWLGSEPAAARLALLSALAPWQVDDPLIESHRATGAAEADILGTVAWAAFSAARRLGAWAAYPR